MGITYDPTKPAANDKPANDQAPMQTNFASIKTLIDVDHIDFSMAAYGEHKQVTFGANVVPSFPTAVPILYTNIQDGASNTLPFSELFIAAGTSAASFTQNVVAGNGSILLMGGIILKWGTAPAAANNMPVSFVNPFPNNCFSVQVTSNQPALTSVGINGFTVSGFTFRSTGFGASITYFAIGN